MKWGMIKGAVAASAVALSLAAGPVQAKETVKIAFIGPLTGGASSIGLGGRNSARLAVQLRNEDPDTEYDYELVTLDDACKPNVGVQVATKAAADREIVGAITQYCSAVAMAAVNVYHRFQLPVIVWGAVLPDITYGNDYPEVHRVNGTMINQNETAARFMTDKGYEKWVIIHDTTDYGKGHNKYFSKSLKANGGEVLGTFGVSSDQQDFTAELTQAKSMDPDVIYFGGLTPVGVRIRRQMERLGIDAQFEGTSGIISDSYIDGLGDLAEGTVAFLEGAPLSKLPGGDYFKAQYEEAGFSEPAEAYGPFAFAATGLLMDTIEEVGPDRAKVTKALAEVDDADSIVGKIRFDEHGQNEVAQITKYVVQDGEWVVWEDSEYASGERSLTGAE